MGFLNAMGKLAKAVTDQFENLVNAEEMEACVAACVLIAAADGSISEAEKEVAFNAVSNHESLKSFSRDKIKSAFDSDANLINSDRILATQVLEKKISVIKDTTARIRILGVVQQIANADGNFSAEEKAVVDRIRRITG